MTDEPRYGRLPERLDIENAPEDVLTEDDKRGRPREPDAVYAGPNINEVYQGFMAHEGPNDGDKVRVGTSQRVFVNPLTVTRDDYNDMRMVSDGGTVYTLTTYNSTHPLEHPEPMVHRVTDDGWSSEGAVRFLEVYHV